MFVICLCARFQLCPKEFHLFAVKRIFRYLKGTLNYDLWYPKYHDFALISFSDAEFVGYSVNRKSSSGSYHFLSRCLVSWFSKKTNIFFIYARSGVYCRRCLLCSIIIDETYIA